MTTDKDKQELRNKIKELIFRPVHVDHQNVEPDRITLTPAGLDYYSEKLATIVTDHSHHLIDKIMSEIQKEPHDYDKWAEHIRLGYDWAIRDVLEILNKIKRG